MGEKIKQLQYKGIDYFGRIREWKVFEKHNRSNSNDFVAYAIDKLTFSINGIQTDYGLGFQSKFNRDIKDSRLEHHYIKDGKPHDWEKCKNPI